MLKKLTLSTIVLSALLLNGCGGGSKSTADKLKNKNGIVIFHNSIAANCTPESITGATGVQVYVEANNVSCATYGRPTTSYNKGEYCREKYTQEGGATACVAGFDDFTSYALAQKDAELLLGDVPQFNHK